MGSVLFALVFGGAALFLTVLIVDAVGQRSVESVPWRRGTERFMPKKSIFIPLPRGPVLDAEGPLFSEHPLRPERGLLTNRGEVHDEMPRLRGRNRNNCSRDYGSRNKTNSYFC